MRVQQIQPSTTFNANKTTRRLDYESYEQLEQILTKMDKETLYKQFRFLPAFTVYLIKYFR